MLKRITLLVLLAGAVVLSQASSQSAQKMQAAAANAAQSAGHHTVKETEVQWSAAPPIFNRGAQMALMDGDPGGAGIFVIRLKMPAGYKIMPHWHPTQENVTVLSGHFQYGMGDKMTPADMTTLGPGGFVALHAKAHHYAMAKDASVVEVSGMGPFQLIYVNPADDPSKAKPAK
jgi:quercetin dioxygenase-like cupin family protein